MCMCNAPRLTKALNTTGLVLFFGMIGACGDGSEKWKEEVQLSDGRVIVIERETVFERGGGELALNGSVSKPKRYRIRMVPESGPKKTIVWNTTKKSPDGVPETPLVFDVEAGVPTVMSSVYVTAQCEMYSRYVYRHGIWIEVALPDQFIQRKTNLLIKDGAGMPQFAGLKEKQAANASQRYRPTLRHVGPDRTVCA